MIITYTILAKRLSVKRNKNKSIRYVSSVQRTYISLLTIDISVKDYTRRYPARNMRPMLGVAALLN